MSTTPKSYRMTAREIRRAMNKAAADRSAMMREAEQLPPGDSRTGRLREADNLDATYFMLRARLIEVTQ